MLIKLEMLFKNEKNNKIKDIEKGSVVKKKCQRGES